jgi:transaldolase
MSSGYGNGEKPIVYFSDIVNSQGRESCVTQVTRVGSKKTTDSTGRVWLNFMNRNLIQSSKFKLSIDNHEVTGIIANAPIMAGCISRDSEYRDEIRRRVRSGMEAEEIYHDLILDDARNAADLLLPVFHSTQGHDGFVGIDICPEFSYDVDAMIEEGNWLWERSRRPNIMIQIPATEEALPAVTNLLQSGINVNATFIHSLTRYRQVVQAYIAGMTERLDKGLPLQGIASAATFSVLGRFDETSTPGNYKRDIDTFRNMSLSAALSACSVYREVLRDRNFLNLAARGMQPQLLMLNDEAEPSRMFGKFQCAIDLTAKFSELKSDRLSCRETKFPEPDSDPERLQYDMEALLDGLLEEIIKSRVVRIDEALRAIEDL